MLCGQPHLLAVIRLNYGMGLNIVLTCAIHCTMLYYIYQRKGGIQL